MDGDANKRKVYVLQDDGTKNLFPAKRWGNLVVFSRHEMSLWDAGWIDDLEQWLADFDGGDHLLLVGDPVLIGAACAIVGRMISRLPLLKWDRQEKTYIPITIDVS